MKDKFSQIATIAVIALIIYACFFSGSSSSGVSSAQATEDAAFDIQANMAATEWKLEQNSSRQLPDFDFPDDDYSEDYFEETSGCPYGCMSYESGCNIKGNVSYGTGEKIYHLPGDYYYDSTDINPEYGERWFCTELEAINAGWRHSKQ